LILSETPNIDLSYNNANQWKITGIFYL
jgi:hypothetical protein